MKIFNSIHIMILIPIVFTLILTILSHIINKKKMKNNSKLSPFECGFNPMLPLRSNFSIQFFMITILFLVFDIEIILILPFPIMVQSSLLTFTSLFTTILILSLGLLLEWKNGSLEWM